MARLEQVIINIVDIFMEYADDGGKKRQLNKEELKNLLQKEIQSDELKVRNSISDMYIYALHSHKLSCVLFNIHQCMF